VLNCREDRYPIFHIITHGSKHGIELNDDFIKWEDLSELLTPINIESKNQLLLTIGSCYGAYASRMFLPNKPAAVKALIGFEHITTGLMNNIAFSRFYKTLIRNGSDLPNETTFEMSEAVNEMNISLPQDQHYKFLSQDYFFDKAINYYIETECTENRIEERATDIMNNNSPNMNYSLVQRFGKRSNMKEHVKDTLRLKTEEINTWRKIFFHDNINREDK
jgi:hypothetical protein